MKKGFITKSAMVAILATTMLSTPVVAADKFSDALISAYQTNPRIKAQRKILEANNETASQAFSGWLPNVNANLQTGRQRNSNSAQTAGSFVYGDSDVASLTLNQPLFSGGETLSQMDKAEYEITAARSDLLELEQQVLLDAVGAYMDVVRDEAVLGLSKNNSKVLAKQLKASKQRFAVGEVTRTDVAQSQSRLSRAKTDKIQARGSLVTSRANFERVIGFVPQGELTTPSSFPAIPKTLEEAFILAEQKSPLITSAENREKSAGEDVDISVAGILPELSLQGNMRREDGSGFQSNEEFNSDSLLLNLDVPLYQSGAEYSLIRQAKINASQQKFNLINQKDAVKESVTQAWEALETAVATIRSNEDAIDAAQIALKGVKQEQLFGARTVLDVLDAEQELFVARVNLKRSQRDRIFSIYNLLAVMGELTVDNLGFDVQKYNPEEHYEDVKYQFIGF